MTKETREPESERPKKPKGGREKRDLIQMMNGELQRFQVVRLWVHRETCWDGHGFGFEMVYGWVIA